MVEGFLMAIQIGLLALLYPTAFILTRAAVVKPYIPSLVLMATIVDAIVLVVTAFVWAVANGAAGHPIPADTARLILRGAFIPLELFGLVFLIAYRRNWFGDESG